MRYLISAAEVTKGDVALEVGAGCGNITLTLAEVAGRVLAVEKNRKFLPLLRERTAPYGNVELILGDVLRMKIPPFDKLVSNLPFSICEALIQRLILQDFKLATVITPTSFAETVTAGEENPHYSRLTLIANAFFTIEVLREIGPDAYYPPPATSTSLLRLKPRAADSPELSVLQQILLQGDKKLKNALREALISSYHLLGESLTKRKARERVQLMGLEEEVLEERVARLSLSHLRLLVQRLRGSL